MGLPDRAVRTSGFTFPPTPAMHDISATPMRSRRIAIWLAIWAALEAPEQEYTNGMRGALSIPLVPLDELHPSLKDGPSDALKPWKVHLGSGSYVCGPLIC